MSWKGEWCRSIISKLRKQPLAHLFSAELDKHERNINDLVSSEKQGSLRKWRDALLSALDGKSSGFKEAVGADLRAWVQRKCHNLPRCRAENWLFEFEATREMLQSLVDEKRKKEPKAQEISVVEKQQPRPEQQQQSRPEQQQQPRPAQRPEPRPEQRPEPRPRQEVKKLSAAYEPVDKYKTPILGDPSAAPRPVEKKITLFGP